MNGSTSIPIKQIYSPNHINPYVGNLGAFFAADVLGCLIHKHSIINRYITIAGFAVHVSGVCRASKWAPLPVTRTGYRNRSRM